LRPEAGRYDLLFIGDVCGKVGRNLVAEWLPHLREEYQPLFVVINGENAAGGLGITPKIAEELFALGADAITLGNHAFNKREIGPYLDEGRPIVRPLNMAREAPGEGWIMVNKEGVELVVMSLCGRVEMEPHYDDPFSAFDLAIGVLPSRHRLVDFHAEATSEKVAFGWHVAGRASAMVGTHTHVATADERILPGATAYQTDTGMTGPRDGVIGMDREIILRRFRSGLPEKFEVAEGAGLLHGLRIRIERASGQAVEVERIRRGDLP